MDHASTAPGRLSAARHILRSVFLGEPSGPESGIVELVELDGMGRRSTRPAPVAGFFLLSLYADLDTVLPVWPNSGSAVSRWWPRGAVRLAVLHDPNGVRVELMDTAAQDTMAR